MEIKTTYAIGDHVWIVRYIEAYKIVQVYDAIIDYITIDKDGYVYGTKQGDDAIEDEIVPYDDLQQLSQTIFKENSKSKTEIQK